MRVHFVSVTNHPSMMKWLMQSTQSWQRNHEYRILSRNGHPFFQQTVKIVDNYVTVQPSHRQGQQLHPSSTTAAIVGILTPINQRATARPNHRW